MNHFYRTKAQVSQEASKLALSGKNADALSTELKVKIPLLLIVTAHARYPIKAEIPQIL